MRVEVKADSLRYKRNIAKGSIDLVKIGLDGFESLKDYTDLQALVTNIDSILGDYLVGLECNEGIIA